MNTTKTNLPAITTSLKEILNDLGYTKSNGNGEPNRYNRKGNMEPTTYGKIYSDVFYDRKNKTRLKVIDVKFSYIYLSKEIREKVVEKMKEKGYIHYRDSMNDYREKDYHATGGTRFAFIHPENIK